MVVLSTRLALLMTASDLTLSLSSDRDAGASLDFAGAPIVRLPAMALGQAFAWCAALRRLLDQQQPFVLIDAGTLAAGSDADRQVRRCWVKRHAAALSAYCCGLIAIEPQVAQRSQTRNAVIASLSGASLRVLTVSSEGLADQLAQVLLKADGSASATTPTGNAPPSSVAGIAKR